MKLLFYLFIYTPCSVVVSFLKSFFFIFGFFFVFIFFNKSLIVFVKLLLLFSYFLFNVVTVFLFVDIIDFFPIYLVSFPFGLDIFLGFLKVILIATCDFVVSIKYTLVTVLNLKNFSGIIYYFVQLVDFVMYEIFREFFDQSQEFELYYYDNWMPRYIFGDVLSRSIRFNKLINLFDLPYLAKEKIFTYRRVGLVNSRFWLFRMYPSNFLDYDDIVEVQVGKLIDPHRQLSDFRRFNLFDYVNPWYTFEHGQLFGRSLTTKNSVQVELLHNYHPIMETPYILPYERVYYDHFVSTIFFFELTVFILLILWLAAFVDEHFQEFNISEELTDDVPEEIESNASPFFVKNSINENFEAKMFSAFPYDFLDYTMDDDLSWDMLLAQPHSLRYNIPVDVDNFEVVKQQNFLLGEFRLFSVLLPIYRLFYKLSLLKIFDLYFFRDSVKFFKILFYLFSYLPIASFVIFIKCFLSLIDWINSLNIFLKVFYIILLICFFLLFLMYF